jgi:hypothetical protein
MNRRINRAAIIMPRVWRCSAERAAALPDDAENYCVGAADKSAEEIVGATAASFEVTHGDRKDAEDPFDRGSVSPHAGHGAANQASMRSAGESSTASASGRWRNLAHPPEIPACIVNIARMDATNVPFGRHRGGMPCAPPSA